MPVAIAGTSSAASSLLNSINAAAQQQQTQQRQQANTQAAQDRQDQQDYAKAIQDGWVPAQTDEVMSTGLINRDPAQTATRPNMDPSRMATIGKKQMYKLTDQESGKAFVPTGQLGDALKTAGWDGRTPVTPEQSHGIMQALNEAQPKDEAYEYDASGKYIDAKTGVPVPGLIGKKTKKFYPIDMSGGQQQQQQQQQTNAQTNGAPAGRPTLQTPNNPGDVPATAPGGGAPGGPFDLSGDPGQPGAQPGQPSAAQPASAFSFSPKEKADKPDVSQILQGVQGPNGGPLIFDHTTQTLKEIPPVPGSKGVLTADQQDRSQDRKVRNREIDEAEATRKTAADQRQAELNQAREDKAAKDHEAAGLKKQAMQSMAQGHWDAAETPPGGAYFEPRYVNGIVVDSLPKLMPGKGPAYDKQVQNLETLAAGFEKTAATHQAEQERIEKARGWGKFAPTTQSAGQPAPATPGNTRVSPPARKPVQPTAAPVAPATAPKTASLANIRAYAQKSGTSEADAIRKAKAEGYSIGQ